MSNKGNEGWMNRAVNEYVNIFGRGNEVSKL